MLVRDSGDDLCVDIDRLDLDGDDCFARPVNSHFPGIHVDPGAGIVTAVVPGALRRTIVYGVVPRNAPRVQIGLSGGRTVDARIAQFPAGLGTHAKVFLAVLPRDVAVSRVRFAGQRRKGVSDTVPLPVREPERQCGYEATRTID